MTLENWNTKLLDQKAFSVHGILVKKIKKLAFHQMTPF
jgi:hypothetical protein